MPFQPGNQIGRKSRDWEAAVRRAIIGDDGKRLRGAAETVLSLAEQGERWAVEMLRDTLDGKARQAIDLQSEEGRTLAVSIVYGEAVAASLIVDADGNS